MKILNELLGNFNTILAGTFLRQTQQNKLRKEFAI
jgi:hypothetical protein